MLSVITATIPGREELLDECHASVEAAGLPHLIGWDDRREGPAVVRNRLVEQAHTPWVVFLDDDDLLYPHYPDTVGPHLPGADVVYTAWDLSGADEPFPHPWFDPDLLRTRNFIPVTACVRVRSFRAVGGFPDAALEDHELWKLLLDRGCRFTYVPTIAWHYRRRQDSRTEASN